MDDDELFTMQMVNLTTMLFDALAGAGGDPMIAAQSPQLLQAWSQTEQQARAGLLLSLAWRSRSTASVVGDTTPEQYAGDLQKFACGHAGDSDSFLGENYPAGPFARPCRTESHLLHRGPRRRRPQFGDSADPVQCPLSRRRADR